MTLIFLSDILAYRIAAKIFEILLIKKNGTADTKGKHNFEIVTCERLNYEISLLCCV